jgi:hypothetical protein
MIFVVLAAASVFAVFGVSSARAAATVCGNAGAPPSGTYDALVVPAGEVCIFSGATIGLTITVTGNIVLEPGAVFDVGGAENHVTVGGNVLVKAGAAFFFETFCLHCNFPSTLVINGSLIAANPRDVALDSGTIGGNVNIVGASLGVAMGQASIGGNILVAGATANGVVLYRNTVAGQVRVVNNQLPVLPFPNNLVEGNTIGGNLVCEGNNPAPVNDGVPNNVLGNELGQCAGL